MSEAEGVGVADATPTERDPNGSAVRTISVMAPMYNEAHHIAAFVEDIAGQDYDGAVELLVADGRSDDGSVGLLREAADAHGVSLTVIDNPTRWVSSGLNRCIAAAKGDLLVRVDCHSRYPADYLRRCAAASEATGADNVGGILVAQGRTPMERAVACAMDSPFGGVLWTRHGAAERVETDTVPYGAFRPDVFARIGLFDETLVRNQDDELNLRLRLSGGRVVLDPSIVVYYTPRGTFARVFRQYYEYGLWKPAVMRKHRRVSSLRSLVPALFVASLALLAVASPCLAALRVLLTIELALYLAGAVVFGVLAVRGCHGSWRLLPRVTGCFPTFHIAYGLGMLVGWARAIR